jgi:hypothetical protein
VARGEPAPADLSAEERRAFEQVKDFQGAHAAYVIMMATRPQMLYGLTDSPVALAAWMIDHGDAYDQPAASIIPLSAAEPSTDAPQARSPVTTS